MVSPSSRRGVSTSSPYCWGQCKITRPGNRKASFERTPECNSPLFGFSNIATLRIPGWSSLLTVSRALSERINQERPISLKLFKNSIRSTNRVKYDVRSDWPRGGRRTKDDTQVVCEAHFDLDAEQDELASLTNSTLRMPKAVVTKNYAGQYTVEFPDRPDFFPNRVHRNDVDQICAKLAVPSAPVCEAFFRTSGECIAEAKQTAHQGRFAELAMLAGPHRERLERAGSADHPQNQNEAQFLSGYVSLLGQISNELAALPTMQRKAHECIIRHLPTFIYMDDHRSFEGTAHLDQVLQRINQPTPQDETLLMIFKLAGLDVKKLIEQGNSHDPGTIRERQYDLQDAGQIPDQRGCGPLGTKSLQGPVSRRWPTFLYRDRGDRQEYRHASA